MELEVPIGVSSGDSGRPGLETPVVPVLALVGPHGRVEQTTATFERLIGERALAAEPVVHALAALIDGTGEGGEYELDGGLVRVRATLEPVIAEDGERRVLVRSAVGHPDLVSLLATFADDSPALIWLKDMSGRHLYVNRTVCDAFGVEPDALLHRRDEELPPSVTVDGPRQRTESRRPEPLELEYTVPETPDRPAYAALRFPLRDGAGTPVATCGVAARVPEARLAREECVRLLELARWVTAGPEAVRAEQMAAWRLEELHGSRHAAAEEAAAELERLSEQLFAAQARIGQLEAVNAELSGAAAQLEGVIAELERRLAEHVSPLAAGLEPPTPAVDAPAPVNDFRWDAVAHGELSRALQSPSSWRAALNNGLRAIGGSGGWEAAVAWTPDGAMRLSCSDMWLRRRGELGVFETATWQREQVVGVSAVGRCASAQEPVWIDDPWGSGDAHLQEAAHAGLHGVLIVPLRDEGELVGVLELCAAGTDRPDPAVEAGLREAAARLARTVRTLRQSARSPFAAARL